MVQMEFFIAQILIEIIFYIQYSFICLFAVAKVR